MRGGGKALERIRLRARRRPPRQLTGFPSACKLALKYSQPLTYCSGRRGDGPVTNRRLARETCTPVEACDHGACIGECVYSTSNDMMVCVTDSALMECEGMACDAQPEGDPECVMPCPGYIDGEGDLVEQPALCLPGEICLDGTFCA